MSTPRLMGVVALLISLSLACSLSRRESTGTPTVGKASSKAEPAEAPAPTVSGDLSLVRTALLSSGEACYRGRAAYCITDPAFVDPILSEVITRSFGGKVPTTADEAEAVARRARGTFANHQMQSPEARQQVEAAIYRYWDHPTVTRDRGLVRADLGVAPGSLERTGRAGYNVASSPLVVDGELAGDTAAGRLITLRQQVPDAATWVLDVEIPVTAGGFVKEEIRYQSNRDRIIIRRADRSNQAWYTPKLGGDLSPYSSGARSLATRDLETCTLKDAIWGVDPDCPG